MGLSRLRVHALLRYTNTKEKMRTSVSKPTTIETRRYTSLWLLLQRPLYHHHHHALQSATCKLLRTVFCRKILYIWMPPYVHSHGQSMCPCVHAVKSLSEVTGVHRTKSSDSNIWTRISVVFAIVDTRQ